MVLEDALRLKSGRLGTEGSAGGTVGLVSCLVGAEELVADCPWVCIALGAGEPFRETFDCFGISAEGVESADALGISTDAGFCSCSEFEVPPSLAGTSVFFASSISPSSTSSFPEAVLTIFGTPLTLGLYISIRQQELAVDPRLTLAVNLAGNQELLDSGS